MRITLFKYIRKHLSFYESEKKTANEMLAPYALKLTGKREENIIKFSLKKWSLLASFMELDGIQKKMMGVIHSAG